MLEHGVSTMPAVSGWFAQFARDVMVHGRDGCPNGASRATTRRVIDRVVADHVTGAGRTSPATRGRITCTTSGPTGLPGGHTMRRSRSCVVHTDL
jgi:hypothetical protein